MAGSVVRAASPEDYARAGELVAGVFSRGDSQAYQRLLRRHSLRPTEPGFSYGLNRVALVNGEVVAYMRVVPGLLRYGAARISVGGLAQVCTHPAHRNQGFSAALLQDAIAYMAEQGAGMALLNGIPGYYQRFGFSPVWPYYNLHIPAAEAARLTSPLRLRPAHTDDVPALMNLYQRHWGGRAAFERSALLWAWRIQHEIRPVQQVVVDKDDGVQGYLSGLSLTDDETEVVADTPEAALALLGLCGAACLEAGMEMLSWCIPPDDALISFARQHVTVNLSALYRPNGGWMARLIDARGFLETLLPEITAQAASTDPAFDPAALLAEAGAGGVRLALRGQPDTLCDLSYNDFLQVAFGSLRPDALAVRPASQLQPAGRRLLELLFPPRIAALACMDWF